MILRPPRIDGLHVREFQPEDALAVQMLFDASPDYFTMAHGKPAAPSEALSLQDKCPEGWSKDDKFLWTIFAEEDPIGVADLIRNYPKVGSWYLGFVFLDSRIRSKGIGQRLLNGISGWVSEHGGDTVRLSVLVQNTGAIRLYERCGFLTRSFKAREEPPGHHIQLLIMERSV